MRVAYAASVSTDYDHKADFAKYCAYLPRLGLGRHGHGDYDDHPRARRQPDVDIFDGQTKKLVWRGTASDTLSSKPEKNDRKLEHAIGEMFDKFPPKEKG